MVADRIELAAARAFVHGAISVSDADVDAILAGFYALRRVRVPSLAGLVRAVVSAPACECRPRGRLRSLSRDRQAISHHYDVGNDFYRLVLGETMVYSCAVFEHADATLEQAQRRKIALILDKLRLARGDRLLDIGCGWGTLLDQAEGRGAQACGVTLSRHQLWWARREGRIVSERDYRTLDGQWDAICSVGAVEHTGLELYEHISRRLAPGGRALVHGITKQRPSRSSRFIARYVFPDARLLPLSQHCQAARAAGLHVADIERIGRHYPRTLRCWIANLEQHRDQAVRLVGEQRYRVWRLYMAASALAFERGDLDVHQLRLTKEADRG